ncbi:A/G-specific adenine glycosylase [Candidatus Peregrinibacteria bacterium]|nr:MAG: A/G-specific adenine glycosylase [Candidatus Peregrinibacteria bacterium]
MKQHFEYILSAILPWYKKNARLLPWRETRDPYYIWVSEIMLQQTQVSRVLDYYRRFLERFPTPESLAEAEWEDLLPVWQGLGYYSRGKNLLKTARILVRQYDGVFPKTSSELQKFPGIGSYTSAAIMSFAFGKPEPALDTNLLRIFQRFFGCTEKGVVSRAKALYERAGKNAPLLNHAFMDLGSEICGSRRAECKACPLQKKCHFYTSGKKEEWENTQISLSAGKKISVKKTAIEVAAACIRRDGKYLIARRPLEKGGNWEFPGGKREKGEDWRHAVKREILEELGINISVRPHFFEETWEEKEFFWRLRFFRCQILSGEPFPHEHDELLWISPEEFSKYNFPSANAKGIARLREMRA